LAQLGEFAFLLASVGYETKIIDSYGQKLIIALTVLSLGVSPIWLSIARRLKQHAATANVGVFRLMMLAASGGKSGWYSRLRAKIKKPGAVAVDEDDA